MIYYGNYPAIRKFVVKLKCALNQAKVSKKSVSTQYTRGLRLTNNRWGINKDDFISPVVFLVEGKRIDTRHDHTDILRHNLNLSLSSQFKLPTHYFENFFSYGLISITYDRHNRNGRHNCNEEELDMNAIGLYARSKILNIEMPLHASSYITDLLT